ncbi:hypothetical protein D7D52_32420 [Nocardia yunnanensis]|uniref:Uncharacterized protein n=1 Tax=Nocardia yunnanensis TaxID=2382165 RepID=A0A386ZKA2_9NOCA|nr:hypothetical protein D7D52_32420 [Nocardia yunnanensis]
MAQNIPNRISTTVGADLCGTTLAALACLIFAAGLIVLTHSLPTAVAGATALAAAWAMTVKMVAARPFSPLTPARLGLSEACVQPTKHARATTRNQTPPTPRG